MFDPYARFKSWDSVFITVGFNVGYGSSKDKAFSRAVDPEYAADETSKAIPLVGCVCRAFSEHAGRKYAMAVSVPANFPRFPETIFAFEDAATRDTFVHRLQV
jgi:hypothetical protein